MNIEELKEFQKVGFSINEAKRLIEVASLCGVDISDLIKIIQINELEGKLNPITDVDLVNLHEKKSKKKNWQKTKFYDKF